MNLNELQDLRFDATTKGMPNAGIEGVSLRELRSMQWNLLAGDLPAPVALLNQRQMSLNSKWMRHFIEQQGVKLCPHGKTTMAPQLFGLQLDDGAWGITVASVQQMLVCRRFGVDRILMANQLVGTQEMKSVFDELNKDPSFSFCCLVDSIENVLQLAAKARELPLKRPLPVLLEMGVMGGRTGCRDFDEAMKVAECVGKCAPFLTLAGIEGFEGVIEDADPERANQLVKQFILHLLDVFEHIRAQGMFDSNKPVISLGGSIYFDLVATHPNVQLLRDKCDVVLRSGCYLTHDSKMLCNNFDLIRKRTHDIADLGQPPKSALQVWGRVQSLPEPLLAIVNIGKRDISYDVDLPVAEMWYQTGTHTMPVNISQRFEVTEINDQHLFLRIPPGTQLKIGDLLGFGVSHPCTTFDKWKLLLVVNDLYDVVDGVLTFF
ncbi:MAG: alanine racemase [Xanthomonadales bacterium]|nr:alanine racemase [Xanthomonadales bacterium]